MQCCVRGVRGDSALRVVESDAAGVVSCRVVSYGAVSSRSLLLLRPLRSLHSVPRLPSTVPAAASIARLPSKRPFDATTHRAQQRLLAVDEPHYGNVTPNRMRSARRARCVLQTRMVRRAARA